MSCEFVLILFGGIEGEEDEREREKESAVLSCRKRRRESERASGIPRVCRNVGLLPNG